jgi:hypothetical protein
LGLGADLVAGFDEGFGVGFGPGFVAGLVPGLVAGLGPGIGFGTALFFLVTAGCTRLLEGAFGALGLGIGARLRVFAFGFIVYYAYILSHFKVVKRGHGWRCRCSLGWFPETVC